MSEKISILVGTMSGTAEMVADEIANLIEDGGYSAKVLRMEKASVASLQAGGLCIICTSTYGTGEVPDNAKALYDALQTQKPDLSSLRYGVIALGDSVYPNTYCFGGKRFDELLSELGATRLGDRLEHDSRGKIYPEEAAERWFETWLPLVQLA